jgi:hypothetical protein
MSTASTKGKSVPIVNECQCDSPPGGGGSCSANQISICRSDGIRCNHQCVDSSPPADLRQFLQQARISPPAPHSSEWHKGRAIGGAYIANLLKVVSVSTFPPSIQEAAIMLLMGRHPDPGQRVTFSLPDDTKEFLMDIARFFSP